MEKLSISVVSAFLVGNEVRAIVRATDKPRATIHLRLTFPVTGPTDIWAAARDEALKYLDVA